MGGISQAEPVECEREPGSAPKEPTEEKKKVRRENWESEIPSCSSIVLFEYKLTP